MLIPFGDKVQMKQVAVKESMQGSGLGSSLLKATEDYALAKGFSLMYCHARETAVAFYACNGYIIKGDMFEEIGIAHYYMEKSL
jgi:predicted GNAT family N-acyltransferase